MSKYPLDWCMTTKNEGAFIQCHFTTLGRFIDLNKLNIHIVDRGSTDNTMEYLNTIPAKKYHVEPYKQEGFNIGHPGSSYGYDLAHKMDYMVRNCGNEEWCVIVHPDVWFLNNFNMELLLELMKEDVGMIGDACGFMAIRRKAYLQSPIGFWPFLGMAIYQRKLNYDEYKININGLIEKWDLYLTGNTLPILGPDVGELLMVQLQILGWKWIPLANTRLSLYHPNTVLRHISGGSGYWMNNENDKIELQQRKDAAKAYQGGSL